MKAMVVQSNAMLTRGCAMQARGGAYTILLLYQACLAAAILAIQVSKQFNSAACVDAMLVELADNRFQPL